MSERESRSFDTKIYDPRDTVGQPNNDVLATIRSVEKEFSKNSAYVALVPRGSSIKGYSQPGSDVDIMILFDSAKIDPVTDHNDFTTEFLRSGAHFFYSDINPEKVIATSRTDRGALVRKLAALSELATGTEVGEYRHKFSVWVLTQPENEQRSLMAAVMQEIMRSEEHNIFNIKKRIPASQLPPVDLRFGREQLWARRLQKIWHLNFEPVS